MAKIQCELKGDFYTILKELEYAIINGSMSASKEDESNFNIGDCLCAVRVFERYSFAGGNRVSLSITLLQNENKIFISAITAGGSQAVFWKLNTIGEETFLDSIQGVIKKYML